MFLGTRGSVPVCSPSFINYGGDTTCLAVTLSGRSIIIDAGSGITKIPETLFPDRCASLLLTHPHIDHLLGLPLCPLLFNSDFTLDIYSLVPECSELPGILERLFSPPLWPITLDMLPAHISFFPASEAFTAGGLQISTMKGIHPGGSTLYRISDGQKTVTIVTDCTLTEENLTSVAAFAKNSDVIIADGMYSPAEFPDMSDYGHSSWDTVCSLHSLASAGRTYITHHSPYRTDSEFDKIHLPSNCFFARRETVFL